MSGFDFDSAMRAKPEKEKTNMRRHILLLAVFIVIGVCVSFLYESPKAVTSKADSGPQNEIGSNVPDINSMINPLQGNDQAFQQDFMKSTTPPAAQGSNPFDRGYDAQPSANPSMENEIPDMI